MKFLVFTIVFNHFISSQAGVTDVPLISNQDDDDEVKIESITRDTLMPANLFDLSATNLDEQPQPSEETWGSDSNPLFRVLRDFIFQAGDGMLDDDSTESAESGATEEIVKLIEKGLIEATTMFLTPSDDENLSTFSSLEDTFDPIKVMNIEESNFHQRMGMATVDSQSNQDVEVPAIANATAACTNCHNALQTCVQQCFATHNCNNVQRQARTCPPTSPRLCSFFTQWSPMDECKSDEDCKSPLLCCSDGCIQTCSPGVWRH